MEQAQLIWQEQRKADKARRRRERGALLGKKARALAEDEFGLAGCTDRFEDLLTQHARRR